MEEYIFKRGRGSRKTDIERKRYGQGLRGKKQEQGVVMGKKDLYMEKAVFIIKCMLAAYIPVSYTHLTLPTTF